MTPLNFIPPLAVGLVAIAIIDVRTHTINMGLLIAGFILAMLLSPWWPAAGIEREWFGMSGALPSIANSSAAMAGAMLLVTGLVRLSGGKLGMGDAYLAALVGLIVGFPLILVVVYGTLLSFVVVAGFMMIIRRWHRKQQVPMAPFIVFGTLIALFLMDLEMQ